MVRLQGRLKDISVSILAARALTKSPLAVATPSHASMSTTDAIPATSRDATNMIISEHLHLPFIHLGNRHSGLNSIHKYRNLFIFICH